jgi:hypothetical protein
VGGGKGAGYMSLTPFKTSFLSSLRSMNKQIFQLVPAGSALTSRHSEWSSRDRSLTWRGCPAFSGVRTTLSPMYTCKGGYHDSDSCIIRSHHGRVVTIATDHSNGLYQT